MERNRKLWYTIHNYVLWGDYGMTVEVNPNKELYTEAGERLRGSERVWQKYPTNGGICHDHRRQRRTH